MLKSRIIPTLLWKDHGLVKGKGFNSWRRTGPVLQTVRVYNARDVDEILLLSINNTVNHQKIDFETIVDVAEHCHVPFTYGGGITNLDQVQQAFDGGVDKISINSSAFDDYKLLEQISSKHGNQALVISIDVKMVQNDSWTCYSHSGTKERKISLIDHIRSVESAGAGELLITSIDRDGLLTGYDLNLLDLVAKNTNLPIIISGGASSCESFSAALDITAPLGLAAASIYHFTETTPKAIKTYLNKKGHAVRL